MPHPLRRPALLLALGPLVAAACGPPGAGAVAAPTADVTQGAQAAAGAAAAIVEAAEAVEAAASPELARRQADRPASELPGQVAAMLERAAFVDLTCHELEGSLPRWTFDRIGARRDEPAVRQALLRLRDAAQPSQPVRVGFGRLDERVRRYARQLLEEGATPTADIGPWR
jgi:hypothetical protein